MRRRSWGLLAGVTLIACSSTNSSAPSGDDAGADVVTTSPDAEATTTQTVGASGGTVTAQGLRLTIPAGALASDIAISVVTGTAAVPAGYTGLSPVFDLEPSGTTFLSPATLDVTVAASASSPVLFGSNGAGGYDALSTAISGTTASASITQLGAYFAGLGPATVDGQDGGVDDAGNETDSGSTDAAPVRDAGDGGGPVGTTDAAIADAAAAADAGATDAGLQDITVTIDGVLTTFAVNPSLSYVNALSTIRADTGTDTFWRLQLGVTVSPATQTCSTFMQPVDPVITYSHYTAGVLDSMFNTKQTQASCNIAVAATGISPGEHTSGTFTATLESGPDAGLAPDAGGTHVFTFGAYDFVHP